MFFKILKKYQNSIQMIICTVIQTVYTDNLKLTWLKFSTHLQLLKALFTSSMCIVTFISCSVFPMVKIPWVGKKYYNIIWCALGYIWMLPCYYRVLKTKHISWHIFEHCSQSQIRTEISLLTIFNSWKNHIQK